ncbi:electron carrier [Myotisia sp. PD_48]|nr:electron carrier [Myotisia sp. PD_48]
MPPSVVTIDTTPDFDFTSFNPLPSKSNATTGRTLLLAPPSIAAHEEKLRALFQTFDRPTTDLQMLDRLCAGVVPLPSNTYQHVLVLADGHAAQTLSRDVYTALVPSMKPGAKLETEAGVFSPNEALEAVLAGLVQSGRGFEKPATSEQFAIPLPLGGKKASARNTVPAVKPYVVQMDDYEAGDDDDELIDEDALLSDEDLKRPDIPPECQPKPGKRRRACKDCSCGLASRLEAEDKARRENADKGLNVLKLQADNLTELDFTVEGKTGSCGNCTLGDAFRCAECPYLGLPAFKPGQEVQILNNVAQL